MKTSPQGLTLIRQFEGIRLAAYQDSAGVWTIGVGHTLTGFTRVKEGDTCTEEQAADWLVGDVEQAESCINSLVKVPLSQNQYDALVSFIFNLGCRAFSTSTLLRNLNGGSYTLAADQFPRWDNVAGKASAGLLKRRIAEQDLFTQENA